MRIDRRTLLVAGGAGVGLVVAFLAWPRAPGSVLSPGKGETAFGHYLKVATDGLQWAIGAGQTDPNLAGSLNLPGIYAAQTDLVDDMNFARDQLNRAFS